MSWSITCQVFWIYIKLELFVGKGSKGKERRKEKGEMKGKEGRKDVRGTKRDSLLLATTEG